MAELLKIKIRIGGLWHAGSYDPQDFLGRLIGDKPWVRNAERSMFETYDNNFFASDFHINMFVDTFKEFGNYVGLTTDKTKVRRVGWPMEYLEGSMSAYKGMDKKDIILFPHRIAPEKQPDIFYDLKDALPQYEFIVCQEKELSKNEYHNLLGEAKMVFSANLQETLGISWYEGCLVDTMPLIPDRLSYTEMAINEFKYPSEWTQDFTSYKKHKKQLMDKIDFMMQNYKKIIPQIWKQKQQLQEKYFSGKQLYGDING